MNLYIAEKPSLARAIADVLPLPHTKGDGFIRVGNGDVVSWCIGHLLEHAEPEAYNAAYKQWRIEHLPIIPDHWVLNPKPKTRKQLTILKNLVSKASQLVHAGDPDREGQLLVDQVIDYFKVSKLKKQSIQRCLISDLNPPAVKRALDNLRLNSEFISLSTSALARSRADWLYGINMTRAYTLQGRKVGYDGLLSVGRVQTPLLGIVVRRDKEIEAFTSKPYFEVFAHLTTDAKVSFVAKWQPSDACIPYMDDEGRVLSKALADNVISRIKDKPGVVQKFFCQNKSQIPPLPYNLSSLQIDASKRYSLSAKQVLDVCQSLYERHKLITYPRSDSRYLPAEHYQQARSVLNALSANSSEMEGIVENADIDIKGRVWNDSKVDAHHAIVPTSRRCDVSKLTVQERQLYELIGRQYVCQFYPKWEYRDTQVDIIIEGGLFVAKARVTVIDGWKRLFIISSKSKTVASAEDDEYPSGELPLLKQGEVLHCHRGELHEKHTQPPKYFTDATLLAAMTGISRFVSEPELRKTLKDTDGLGTEATRAGIIELLFKRGFLIRNGKQIRSSPAARVLIETLPLSATTPDMTAQWEMTLESIRSSSTSYQDFIEPLTCTLSKLIQQSLEANPEDLRGQGAPRLKNNHFRNKKTVKSKAKAI